MPIHFDESEWELTAALSTASVSDGRQTDARAIRGQSGRVAQGNANTVCTSEGGFGLAQKKESENELLLLAVLQL